jgi:very-short-patch-repair endonuclease
MPHSGIEPRLRTHARANRREPTWGEKVMWTYLRSFRPLGARFRREAPIGPYMVDFAWLSARIIIEVDGASHDLPGRDERDQERDSFLTSQGFRVIRVRDADVIANSEKGFAAIEEAVRPHLKTPPLAPPHKGEGNRAGPVGDAAGPESPSPNPSPQGGGGSRPSICDGEPSR